MMDTLLNFSGGLDSVYCLWKYLKENPDKTLLVHHCHWMTSFNRHEQESRAVEDVLDWLRKEGLDNFEYIETMVDIRQIRIKPVDHQIISFLTGAITLNPKYNSIEYLISPTPKDEIERLGKDIYKIWEDAEHIRSLTKVTVNKSARELKVTQPIKDKYKHELIAELPQGLKELYFSCRTPKKGLPCGKCHTCRQISR